MVPTWPTRAGATGSRSADRRRARPPAPPTRMVSTTSLTGSIRESVPSPWDVLDELASIGATGGIIGRRMRPSCHRLDAVGAPRPIRRGRTRSGVRIRRGSHGDRGTVCKGACSDPASPASGSPRREQAVHGPRGTSFRGTLRNLRARPWSAGRVANPTAQEQECTKSVSAVASSGFALSQSPRIASSLMR